jgi:hypothetical protein
MVMVPNLMVILVMVTEIQGMVMTMVAREGFVFF